MNGLPASAPKSERDDDYEEFGSGGTGAGGNHKASSHNPSYYNFNNSNPGTGNFGGTNNPTGTSAPNQSTSNAHNSSASARNQCCLIDDGKRCHRASGNASYSKRIQKTVYYKRLRLETDANAQHIYICDYHKMVIQNARTRQKKDSEEDPNEADEVPEVDLYQLQVNTLRRYKKHFKLSSRPGLNKAQLSDILMRHFRSIPVVEKEIVTYFIYSVKSERNKLEQNRHDAPVLQYELPTYKKSLTDTQMKPKKLLDFSWNLNDMMRNNISFYFLQGRSQKVDPDITFTRNCLMCKNSLHFLKFKIRCHNHSLCESNNMQSYYWHWT